MKYVLILELLFFLFVCLFACFLSAQLWYGASRFDAAYVQEYDLCQSKENRSGNKMVEVCRPTINNNNNNNNNRRSGSEKSASPERIRAINTVGDCGGSGPGKLKDNVFYNLLLMIFFFSFRFLLPFKVLSSVRISSKISAVEQQRKEKRERQKKRAITGDYIYIYIYIYIKEDQEELTARWAEG
eukprot:gene11755-8083_t